MKFNKKRFKPSLAWTFIIYGVITIAIIISQYNVYNAYNGHIKEARDADMKLVSERGQVLEELIRHDIPTSILIEDLYHTAISLRYEINAKFIEQSEINPDFNKFSKKLLNFNNSLKTSKYNHITNVNDLIDANIILSDIALEAFDLVQNNDSDFKQLYNDTKYITDKIINNIDITRKIIAAHNNEVSLNYTNDVIKYEEALSQRLQKDDSYSLTYSLLMSITIAVPFIAMLLLYLQLYDRLRKIEKYAHDIAHEKYTLPPFTSSDPTGKLALSLCLVGRKIRTSLEDSREHSLKTENALFKAEKLASFDPLTGMVNRRFFNKYLQKELKIHDNNRYFLFLDLDNFKDVNDIHGHDVGDELLVSISNKLKDEIRPKDVICRMGGDEFAIFIHASRDNIKSIVERMLRVISIPTVIGGEKMSSSMSIGVVNVTSGINVDTMMKHADMAMYHAKQCGRNRFKFFSKDLEDIVIHRQGTLHELRNALANMEFVLFYQPKISLITNSINGYEALIRWQHPTKGLVQPNDFIPIVENSDVIHPLGLWVLEEACKHSLILQKSGINIPVSVNVSPKQFYAKNFLLMVDSVLESQNMPTNLLEFEITESILMDNLDLAVNILNSLRQKGIRISIDDFGTGYSSMKYLRDLPVDIIKIDRSFVANISKDKKDREILSSMAGLGKNLDLEVIAEGVETNENLNYLKHIGCDTGQGYLFSRPIPFDELQNYFINYEEKHSSAIVLSDVR